LHGWWLRWHVRARRCFFGWHDHVTLTVGFPSQKPFTDPSRTKRSSRSEVHYKWRTTDTHHPITVNKGSNDVIIDRVGFLLDLTSQLSEWGEQAYKTCEIRGSKVQQRIQEWEKNWRFSDLL
jgi:hypothetical protein